MRTTVCVAAAAIAVLHAIAGHAQGGYPARPIRIKAEFDKSKLARDAGIRLE